MEISLLTSQDPTRGDDDPGARERESDWIYSLTAEPAEGEQGERASVEGMGCTLDEELLNSPVRYRALIGGA
ncbi:MAG: hypothetical protein CXX71_02265 [Methanobacteriota archaeon]|nr:MAG: hypothetical protein CXX71_02265 [Euryarchaeota archaeon]